MNKPTKEFLRQWGQYPKEAGFSVRHLAGGGGIPRKAAWLRSKKNMNKPSKEAIAQKYGESIETQVLQGGWSKEDFIASVTRAMQEWGSLQYDKACEDTRAVTTPIIADLRQQLEWTQKALDMAGAGGMTELVKNIADLQRQLDEKQKLIKLSCQDWADDDTRIKELAKPFGVDTDGDGYAFKGMVEVVEDLCSKLKQAEAQCAIDAARKDK